MESKELCKRVRANLLTKSREFLENWDQKAAFANFWARKEYDEALQLMVQQAVNNPALDLNILFNTDIQELGEACGHIGLLYSADGKTMLARTMYDPNAFGEPGEDFRGCTEVYKNGIVLKKVFFGGAEDDEEMQELAADGDADPRAWTEDDMDPSIAMRDTSGQWAAHGQFSFACGGWNVSVEPTDENNKTRKSYYWEANDGNETISGGVDFLYDSNTQDFEFEEITYDHDEDDGKLGEDAHDAFTDGIDRWAKPKKKLTYGVGDRFHNNSTGLDMEIVETHGIDDYKFHNIGKPMDLENYWWESEADTGKWVRREAWTKL
jgi:hypothetical protein